MGKKQLNEIEKEGEQLKKINNQKKLLVEKIEKKEKSGKIFNIKRQFT